MSEYSGVVQRHLERPFGNKTFYSFTLSGVDGFFGTGVRKPPAEGTSIAFAAKHNAKGFLEVDTKTIEVLEDQEPTVAAISVTPSPAKGNGHTASTASGGVTLKGYGSSGASSNQQRGYWDRREERDLLNDKLREIGASRNTAISIVDLMVKLEAIKLPAVAKREDFLWEVIDKYTNKLMGSTKDAPAEPASAPGNAVPNNDNEDEAWESN